MPFNLGLRCSRYFARGVVLAMAMGALACAPDGSLRGSERQPIASRGEPSHGDKRGSIGVRRADGSVMREKDRAIFELRDGYMAVESYEGDTLPKIVLVAIWTLEANARFDVWACPSRGMRIADPLPKAIGDSATCTDADGYDVAPTHFTLKGTYQNTNSRIHIRAVEDDLHIDISSSPSTRGELVENTSSR